MIYFLVVQYNTVKNQGILNMFKLIFIVSQGIMSYGRKVPGMKRDDKLYEILRNLVKS